VRQVGYLKGLCL